MNKDDMLQAIHDLAKERGIDEEVLFQNARDVIAFVAFMAKQIVHRSAQHDEVAQHL